MEADEIPLSTNGFVNPSSATPFVEIRGTGERQNPARRKLVSPARGETLYVRFRLGYAAETIDTAAQQDGEFFVLWLDQVEGSASSSHSNGVPNIGIHVDEEGTNRFMVRFSSHSEVFGPALEGDREYTLVARLGKSEAKESAPFDELSLWVDPDPENAGDPVAVTVSRQSLSSVSWIGLSTGKKTEPEDRILVGDLRLAASWADLFGTPPAPGLTTIPKPPRYHPPAPPTKIAEVDPQPDSLETDHWSFQPIQRPKLPIPTSADWVRSPIDAFIAAKHETAGFTPAPPVSATELTRRVSLVLTGLPPDSVVSLEGIDDYSEKLLQSPAHGEHWGRHWLDVARWAESNGHQHNRIRDHAWRYRDWVIDSFVENKPYDEFLREQIAGDEIEPFDSDHLIATGFLAAARYSGNELDKAIQRNDILVDLTNTTAKAFLGLTMECAQCHDHFFDPVTQWDYYNLMAFFAQGQPGDVVLSESSDSLEELVQNRWGIFESVRARLVDSRRAKGVPEPILVIPKSVPGGMNAAEKQTFQQIEARLAQLPRAWAYYSPVTSPHALEFAPTAIRWPLPFQKESLETVSVRFLDRGDVNAVGPVATPQLPLVFGTPKTATEANRSALADWLTDPANPLTARVWVNRIWQWHFGTGLVATSGDFGVAGSDPSHPELLDWLACELIDSGWDTRHIQRLILRSNTFRQGSQFSAAHQAADPDNVLLWRWLPRRLGAESIRDSMLAVAGTLDSKIGGISVPASNSESSRRRSLYLQQRRDNLPHQQQLFDSSNAVTSCARRRTSTIGLQPLWLMNSVFAQQRATELAARIRETVSAEDAPTTSVRRLIETVLLREATEQEIEDLQALLLAGSSLEELATVLMNTNEFLYLP